ncbi:hypothetical protein BV509_19295 [Rhodovulum sulfidophilum]|nr:hypothetical protein BV509_19295 [Rhodovulum sulfidophilum]
MMQDASASARPEAARPAARHPDLLGEGLDGFAPITERRATLRAALADLGRVGDATAARGALRLTAQLDALEPCVTFIGQVKAGKTSLINAMVGWPGLLPEDVNPWTSVVTSLHLAPAPQTLAGEARFRFFDREEWARLVEKGGRLGELASRAGAEDELDKVRRQVERMREKSQGRLGRRFELLLGQEHRYSAFDLGLVERYVCLGDDFADDEHGADARFEAAGRFADITKSADLQVDHAAMPLRLCLRDTPGVNDTFLMREQITIGAIRDSRLCVLVLSAHQALSSVDMALIRLIATVKARDVVIFVNRIDELSDPVPQVAEIRAAIRATLQAQNGPVDAPILFGSAIWAAHALGGTLPALPEDSRRALQRLARERFAGGEDPQTQLRGVWDMSGLPALYRTLAERLNEGAGREALDRIARSTANLARSIGAAQGTALPAGARPTVGRAELEARIMALSHRAEEALVRVIDREQTEFRTRLERSHRSFLDRATAALIAHLETEGEDTVWTYEPTGLRMLLRTACQLFGTRMQAAARSVLDELARDVAAVYRNALGLDVAFTVEAPDPPRIGPPVDIACTIALDVKGSWWRRWWTRRRGHGAFAADFHAMIRDDTLPILDALRHDHAERVRADLMATLAGFIEDQREIVEALTCKDEVAPDALDVALRRKARQDRLQAIESAMTTMLKEAA